MNRSWKLVIGVCLAIVSGVGLGLVSMITQNADAVAVKNTLSKVETPWKNEFSNLKTMAVLLRKGSDALPADVLKIIGPFEDSLINTAKLAEKFAEVVETNRLLILLQALECLVQSDKFLLAEARKLTKTGKETSSSGCPDVGCVNKRVCMAVNIKLMTELVKEFTDILLGFVKEKDGKKVFVSGLLYNDIEFFHNSLQVALSANTTLKVFPKEAQALVEQYLVKPSEAVLKIEPRLAKTIDASLKILKDVLPLLVGGGEYIKRQKVSKEDAEKYLEKQLVIVEDPLIDFEQTEREAAKK